MNITQSNLESGINAPVGQLEEQGIAYEAPAVESVLTPEDLEREVHYAGVQAGSGGPVAG